ncbi:MAG: trehalose-phosphatase [Smithellaceae bacterium]|jgi:trehalose 6-phosphate phosphatase
MSQDSSAQYLFEKNSFPVLEHFLDRSTLFAFDLDGTLAPIVSHPDAAGIPDAVREELSVLAGKAPVAVITGRSRPDALRHLMFAPRYLVGNHGAEGLSGWKAREKAFVRATRDWQRQLEALIPAEDREGIVMENKGSTISVHYRHAENRKKAHAMIRRAAGRLVPPPRLVGGKCVENLIPEDAPDKGAALKLLMRQAGCSKAFFAGDDETDEDVFRLNHKRILAVRVGRKNDSSARFFLREQSEIARLLREINRILGRS